MHQYVAYAKLITSTNRRRSDGTPFDGDVQQTLCENRNCNLKPGYQHPILQQSHTKYFLARIIPVNYSIHKVSVSVHKVV